jgi:D-alanyl-D-alanine carboxypeptidase
MNSSASSRRMNTSCEVLACVRGVWRSRCGPRDVRLRSVALCIALTAVIASTPSVGTSAAGSRNAKLHGLLSAIVARAHAPGGVLLVETPTGTWRGSIGLARLKPRVAMRTTNRFRVASVTKPFTAALVLQLAAEGKLSLDDAVEGWLPGRVPNGGGSSITIRDLLGHRSGLVNLGSGTGPIAVSGPPGAFYYANANYELLGAIVEAATGSTYAVQLSSRILRPLGLAHTELPTADVPLAGLAHGYSPEAPRPGASRFDFTYVWNGLSPTAAGLVSSADDLARFERALFVGEVIPRALVALMQTPGTVAGYPTVGYTAYGLGLMRLPTPCGDAWGHRGKIIGYASYLFSSADGKRTVVALVNDGELGNPIVAKLNPLVVRALCS